MEIGNKEKEKQAKSGCVYDGGEGGGREEECVTRNEMPKKNSTREKEARAEAGAEERDARVVVERRRVRSSDSSSSRSSQIIPWSFIDGGLGSGSVEDGGKGGQQRRKGEVVGVPCLRRMYPLSTTPKATTQQGQCNSNGHAKGK